MQSADSTSNAAAAAPAPAVRMTLEAAIAQAQSMQRQEKLDVAESIYLEILAQLPDEPNALNFLGILRHQQQRPGEAIALLQRATELVPEAAGPWLNLGNVLLESDRYEPAAQALARALQLDPGSAAVHNNLGVALMRAGQLDPAEQAFQEGLVLEPERADLHYNYARMLYLADRKRESIAHSIQALDIDPAQPESRQLLSLAYHVLGDKEKAAETLHAWKKLDPANPQVDHLLAVVGASEVPARASDHYVAHVFDGFAASFDRKLALLGYRAPQLCAELLAGFADRLPAAPTILDAGCGTGLCGPLLRPLAARLIGVDLSANMLDRARRRAIYDELERAELTAFLERSPRAFDVILSADTLCYFGALEGFVAAARLALRENGILIFSLEAMPDDARDFTLHIHGRYSHSGRYVERVLSEHGMQLQARRTDVLRREMDEPVDGWLIAATRAA